MAQIPIGAIRRWRARSLRQQRDERIVLFGVEHHLLPYGVKRHPPLSVKRVEKSFERIEGPVNEIDLSRQGVQRRFRREKETPELSLQAMFLEESR